MRFLVDECLHTSLLETINGRGYEAHHVARLNRAGAADWDLMALVRERDFVFVTNNACDFRRLFGREELHCGLVLIVPNVPPPEQRRLMERALDTIDENPDLLNKAIEVTFEADEIAIERYELPSE